MNQNVLKVSENVAHKEDTLEKRDPHVRNFPGDVEIPNRVFVKGFNNKEATENDLINFFERYGAVRDANIVRDKHGLSKGYAFVTFDSQTVAGHVQNKGKITYKDRELAIGPATVRPKRKSAYPPIYPQVPAEGAYYIVPEGYNVFPCASSSYPPQQQQIYVPLEQQVPLQNYYHEQKPAPQQEPASYQSVTYVQQPEAHLQPQEPASYQSVTYVQQPEAHLQPQEQLPPPPQHHIQYVVYPQQEKCMSMYGTPVMPGQQITYVVANNGGMEGLNQQMGTLNMVS